MSMGWMRRRVAFLGKGVAMMALLGLTCVASAARAEADSSSAAAPAVVKDSEVLEMKDVSRGADFIAIALVVGLACVAAGYAVGKVGTAAIGLIAEKPEMLGRSLIMIGLAEGIAIYGLIFGILLLQKL